MHCQHTRCSYAHKFLCALLHLVFSRLVLLRVKCTCLLLSAFRASWFSCNQLETIFKPFWARLCTSSRDFSENNSAVISIYDNITPFRSVKLHRSFIYEKQRRTQNTTLWYSKFAISVSSEVEPQNRPYVTYWPICNLKQSFAEKCYLSSVEFSYFIQIQTVTSKLSAIYYSREIFFYNIFKFVLIFYVYRVHLSNDLDFSVLSCRQSFTIW